MTIEFCKYDFPGQNISDLSSEISHSKFEKFLNFYYFFVLTFSLIKIIRNLSDENVFFIVIKLI